MPEKSFAPLILTLKLDPQTFEVVDPLRQQYFPPQRNFLPAHVTLFHALPGEQIITIQETLQNVCSNTSKFSLNFPQLQFLGNGVVIAIQSPELLHLRQQLANQWQDWLTRQDRQGYRPHITIQNKVTAEEARQVYDRLTETWQPMTGQGEGILLWHYRGGPWELSKEFAFNSSLTP